MALPLSLLGGAPSGFAQEIICPINVKVQDGQGNPKANTPVKLIALSYGNQSQTKNTDSNGWASFDMTVWPNQCSCPATCNSGNYRATAVDYCRSTDFSYTGYQTSVTITVGLPCQREP